MFMHCTEMFNDLAFGVYGGDHLASRNDVAFDIPPVHLKQRKARPNHGGTSKIDIHDNGCNITNVLEVRRERDANKDQDAANSQREHPHHGQVLLIVHTCLVTVRSFYKLMLSVSPIYESVCLPSSLR